MAHAVPLPPEASGLQLLDRIDYQDAFAAGSQQKLTAATWGSLILQAAPRPMLALAWFVQRYALGLALAAPNAERPMGSWTVLETGPDTYVLAADGPFARARLVGFLTDAGAGVATLMTLESKRVRVAWALIAPIHRAFLRAFIKRAVAEAPKPSRP